MLPATICALSLHLNSPSSPLPNIKSPSAIYPTSECVFTSYMYLHSYFQCYCHLGLTYGTAAPSRHGLASATSPHESGISLIPALLLSPPWPSEWNGNSLLKRKSFNMTSDSVFLHLTIASLSLYETVQPNCFWLRWHTGSWNCGLLKVLFLSLELSPSSFSLPSYPDKYPRLFRSQFQV